MAPLLTIMLISLFVISSHSAVVSQTNELSTLKLVSVLFRHGDRTTDTGATWPKDPYKNETYYPYGIGQLTNNGKRREYRLGRKLRQRYIKFLGNMYNPDVIDAVSTDYNRTKMSLSLVTTALFPPKGSLLEWNEELDWQPVPYNCLSVAHDRLMSFPLYYCPRYVKDYETYLNSPAGQQIEQKYSEKYRYLSKHTGLNITSTADVMIIYGGLVSQQEWGFELPDWAHSVYPEYLQNVAADIFALFTATTELKQLSGGFLLKKIINDMQLKINKELVPQTRKMFLYSGHDINVAYLLGVLEVFTPSVPPYGSCVMVELHRINNVNGVKIYYEDYSGTEPRLLKVPGCDYFCPFSKFITLLKKNIPISDTDCDLSTTFQYSDSKSRYWGIYS